VAIAAVAIAVTPTLSPTLTNHVGAEKLDLFLGTARGLITM
jgi:hypothetical protein